MQNYIIFLAKFIEVGANILNFAIFARVILSWMSFGNPVQLGKITGFIYDITDPIMNFLRRFPMRIGMIDLTPLVAMIGINILSSVLIYLLYNIPLK
jgi:YggT family protein